MLINCQAHIDVEALRHNLQQVRKRALHSKVLAMIKSNGYGHELLAVAKALQDADGFGLARLQEAKALREAGITTPMVLMEGFLSEEELQLVCRYNFSVVLHQQWQVELLLARPISEKIKVWLKIETGMHRLGLMPQQAHDYYAQLKQCPWIDNDIGLMTHFACAEEVHNPLTRKQLQSFDAITAELSGEKSTANSAAIITNKNSHRDWVRPGLMLFGVSPIAEQSALDLNLRPVMTLTSRLIAKRELNKGAAIGYGSSWRCPETMAVGIVAAGYGDGYPREVSSGTPVLLRNKLCSILGRVSMDMISIDLRQCPEANIGDTVTLWGRGLPVELIAEHANTIPYPLLTGVTKRVDYTIHD